LIWFEKGSTRSRAFVFERKIKSAEFIAALRNYQKALTIHPDEPNIYCNIGRIHIESNRREESKSFFEKALQIDPAVKDARDVLKATELGLI